MNDQPAKSTFPKISFNLVLLCILLLVMLSAGITAYFMARDGKWMTYQECERLAGSRIQESYPRVCVTSKGEQFTNPSDKPDCGRAGRQPAPEPCK